MLKRTVALVTLLLWLPCAEAAITLSSAQVATTPQYTRLILESNEPITHVTSNQATQLVIDLNEVKGNATMENLARKIRADDPFLKHLSITHTDSVTRLTFELKNPVKLQTLTMEPMKSNRYRLVFELSPNDPPPASLERKAGQRPDMGILINLSAADNAASVKKPPSPSKSAYQESSITAALAVVRQADIEIPPVRAPSSAAHSTRPNIVFHEAEPTQKPRVRPALALNKPDTVGEPYVNINVPLPEAPRVQKLPPAPKTPFITTQEEDSFSPPIENNSSWQNGRRMLVIAIDAGHGGQDPGALGRYGSYEKTITLAIARQVKNILANTPNLRGVLTRQGDVFIPLAERVERAHQANADLFISIHADSFVNASAQGSSVYTLSKHGASSSAADWLANKENNADAIGGVAVAGKDAALMRTLFDLSQTAAVKDSQHLASHILTELGRVNELHRGKVEKAGFAVLKSPKVPSILIETAFISNPSEESRLNDANYQARVAQAIVKGIQHYFAQNPAVNSQKIARSN
ncbi:MAG: N-acetylmuramoyl-L-alanine amidase [Gallionella sp.]|nr:N-acetylmuramoyl-L-alanine amidase [Gallionella sp.]MDD4958082.1 N-acetylmuramoyl-L-alanine amidase [Gallionella sp.]